MQKITIYSTKTCGYCRMLKDYLQSKGIAFEEKKADEDQKIAIELYEKSQQLGVPFTVVTDDEGKETKILGFDRQKIDQVLSL